MSDADRRQVKRIVIGREVLLDIFNPQTRCVNGLPDDATLVKWWNDPARDSFEIMIQSETFPPVEEGEKAPEYDIVFEDMPRYGTQSGRR
jgi:hypothetical protein